MITLLNYVYHTTVVPSNFDSKNGIVFLKEKSCGAVGFDETCTEPHLTLR